MRRIAVINQKGGVGKTTTTANLGAALARAGKRVLLVDLDPQAHLSLHYGVELTDDQPSVYDVLTSSMPASEVMQAPRERVRLLPADIDLAGVEAELVSVMGREVILREAVDKVADDFDVMLIDCPPSLGVLTINALVAASEVLIPLQAQFFALQGLGKLLNTVTLVRQRINPAIRVEGIMLCMHEPLTKLAGEVVDDLSSFLEGARGSDVPWANARLFSTFIRRNIKLAEACSFGQTIFDYAPRSNGATDYMRLAAEVFTELAAQVPAEPASQPRVTNNRFPPPEPAEIANAEAPKSAAPKAAAPKAAVPKAAVPKAAVPKAKRKPPRPKRAKPKAEPKPKANADSKPRVAVTQVAPATSEPVVPAVPCEAAAPSEAAPAREAPCVASDPAPVAVVAPVGPPETFQETPVDVSVDDRTDNASSVRHEDAVTTAP